MCFTAATLHFNDRLPFIKSLVILGNCDGISTFFPCFLNFIYCIPYYFHHFKKNQSISFISMFVHAQEWDSSPGFDGVLIKFFFSLFILTPTLLSSTLVDV